MKKDWHPGATHALAALSVVTASGKLSRVKGTPPGRWSRTERTEHHEEPLAQARCDLPVIELTDLYPVLPLCQVNPDLFPRFAQRCVEAALIAGLLPSTWKCNVI